MKLRSETGRQVKINSLKYLDRLEWKTRVEEVLIEGSLPIVENFDRDSHLEATIELALRHRLTVLLNPQQTECRFKRHLTAA
jgi:hypothetical protein